MNENLLSKLTVIILTYKTNREILSNCLKSIDEKVKIKIIENSENFENEKEFLSNFSNLTIECTGKNLGFGGGNNFGFNKTNTKFVLALSPDTICDKDFFENIKLYLKDNLDFSLIGVSYYQNEPFPTYGYFNKSKKKETLIDSLIDVDWIAGCAMLINLDKYKNKKIFDENFFLFWEETDLCFRTINKNEKIFMSEDLKINHLGFKSSVVENELSLLKLRNWHYMWSFFYFHKKNFSYFKAFKKTFGRLIRSIIRVIFYSITLNKKNRVIYTYRFLGLINSMIGNKSYYRIKD